MSFFRRTSWPGALLDISIICVLILFLWASGVVAVQQGAAAGGSQAPVVNRRVRASMLAMPHLRVVDR